MAPMTKGWLPISLLVVHTVRAQPVSVSMRAKGSAMLREKPLLLAHDAAMGYVGRDDVRGPWIKTQSKDLVGQLDCGARALDLRLGNINGAVRFHHAGAYVDQGVDDTIPSVVDWANNHTSELVLLLLSHCYTGKDPNRQGCDGYFQRPFGDLGIHVVNDAPRLANMTLAEAEQLATLAGGGKLLAILADDAYVDSTFGAANSHKVWWYGPLGVGGPKSLNFKALWA